MLRLPLILTLAVAMPTLTLAQTPDLLGIADSNADGSITREEVSSLRLALFNRLDADADGLVTRAEIEAAKAKAAAQRAARDPFRLDGNGDGALSQEEFTAILPGFDRADRDGDGVLSSTEIDRVRKFMALLQTDADQP